MTQLLRSTIRRALGILGLAPARSARELSARLAKAEQAAARAQQRADEVEAAARSAREARRQALAALRGRLEEMKEAVRETREILMMVEAAIDVLDRRTRNAHVARDQSEALPEDRSAAPEQAETSPA